MKVEYKTVLYGEDSSSYTILSYKKDDVYNMICLNVEHCCGDMADSWEDIIDFGEEVLTTQPTVNIYQVKYGDCVYEIPIQYCPFCGEPIKCIEVKRVQQVRKMHTVKREESYYDEIDV